MIETLISSKTRIKLLLKFFLNSSTKAYLRSLEAEFGESSNAIRLELNRFEKAGMLESNSEGNKKIFTANKKHPLYNEVQKIVMKHVGIDKVIENIVSQLGNLNSVYLAGDFAKGKNSNIIDLIIVGDVNTKFLLQLVEKTENLIKRKVRYIVYQPNDIINIKTLENRQDYLLLWSK